MVANPLGLPRRLWKFWKQHRVGVPLQTASWSGSNVVNSSHFGVHHYCLHYHQCPRLSSSVLTWLVCGVPFLCPDRSNSTIITFCCCLRGVTQATQVGVWAGAQSVCSSALACQKKSRVNTTDQYLPWSVFEHLILVCLPFHKPQRGIGRRLWGVWTCLDPIQHSGCPWHWLTGSPMQDVGHRWTVLILNCSSPPEIVNMTPSSKWDYSKRCSQNGNLERVDLGFKNTFIHLPMICLCLCKE